MQIRWEQKDSHSEVGRGTGTDGSRDHVSESHLLLADRHPTHLPIGPALANQGITNRKSVPPSQKEDDLRSKSCQKSITTMCPIFHIHCLDIGNMLGIKTHKCPNVTPFSTSVFSAGMGSRYYRSSRPSSESLLLGSVIKLKGLVV